LDLTRRVTVCWSVARHFSYSFALAKGEKVEGLGGSFRFCELGEPLFDQTGKIRETVRFAELARHVYFTEIKVS
jgi:adenine-specific DNA-methyltransferase